MTANRKIAATSSNTKAPKVKLIVNKNGQYLGTLLG